MRKLQPLRGSALTEGENPDKTPEQSPTPVVVQHEKVSHGRWANVKGERVVLPEDDLEARDQQALEQLIWDETH